MKKITLIVSTILAGSLMVGGAFAAFAVTDQADPFGIHVSPGDVEEDTDTHYTTLEWGAKTSLHNVEQVVPGHIYKVGVVSLKSTLNYRGVFSIQITDQTTGKNQSDPHFIDYVQFYLYEGAHEEVAEDTLPETGFISNTSLGGTSLIYDNALGTSAGKEYSVYLSYDYSAIPVSSLVSSDVINIEVDWSPAEGDLDNDQKKVYFASSWDNCYIYSWKGNVSNASWPGVSMTKIGVNQYNQNIYEGILMPGYDSLIFSNGGNNNYDKTNDLSIASFDFTSGDLLFWRNEDGSAGTMVYDDSILSYASNMGKNPGPILQAWGWTTEKVKQNMTNIKNAGFKAVQLSPMQPVGGGSSTNDGWYMLYQPLGFKVADNGENPIGNKTSLSELTAVAEAAGVDIIVDVVCNHLAGGDGQLWYGVRNYEQQIYDNNMVHHDGNCNYDDNDSYNIVRGHVGGLPDLQTENEYIQGRVISMLEEYIDCGVKGFRFDAAKHIETPLDDNSCKSDFWPNVIGAINRHGTETYGKAPFSYGECLGAGNYRNWAGYTNYIDVTDNGVAWASRAAYTGHDEGSLGGGAASYTVGGGEHAVLYGETHDNFLKEGTADIYGPYMNALYGFHASRLASSAFYFARPCAAENKGNDTKIVINNPLDDYYHPVVSAANKLHNDFVGGSEYLSSWGGCAINAVRLGDSYGAYICNVHGASSATVKVRNGNESTLPAGTYRNLVNNTTVQVYDNAEFTVNLTDGVAVLERI